MKDGEITTALNSFSKDKGALVTIDYFFLQMMLSVLTLIIGIVLACLTERKAAICAHYR
jgi:hypothetical protein